MEQSTLNSFLGAKTDSVTVKQGKFNQEQKTFLLEHLPAYGEVITKCDAHGTGPCGIGSIKGDKREWIIEKVYLLYIKKFKPEGKVNLECLQNISRAVLLAVIMNQWKCFFY